METKNSDAKMDGGRTFDMFVDSKKGGRTKAVDGRGD